MLRIDPLDGEAVVYLQVERPIVMMELLGESEASAARMGYIHDWRCFVNYLIAHYEGDYVEGGIKLHSPLKRFI